MDLESSPVMITVIGVDERVRNALRMFFKGPCNNQCVMVEEDSAEACIVDLDAYQGKELYENYKERHPEQPVILISLHEPGYENIIFLKKPLNANSLNTALGKVQEKIAIVSQQKVTNPTAPIPSGTSRETEVELQPDKTTKSSTNKVIRNDKTIPSTTHHAAMYLGEQNAKVVIGTAPDIDPYDTKQLLNAQYKPEDFIQSHIHHACIIADKNNRCVQMETPRGAIYIFPDGHGVAFKFSDSQLRTLSVVPILKSSLTTVIVGDDFQLDQDSSSMLASRDSLLWKTALWASRGRVPQGTSLDTPVYLKRWPNLTRLLLFPHALRIAALWANQPQSLISTAKLLDIPQRYVFGFYSAAHALGLTSASRRAVDKLIEPEPITRNQRHSLFSKILKRLRRN